MKRRTELVKRIRKTTAVAMAATTVLGVTSNVAQVVTYAMDKSNYVLLSDEYSTRLKKGYDDRVIFEFGFREKGDEGQVYFNHKTAEEMVKNAKIKINDGQEYSFKDAGINITQAAYGGSTNSYFDTKKESFIKEFYNKDKFKVTIITPEGYEVSVNNISNQLTKEEREEFKNKLDQTSSVEDSSEPSEQDSGQNLPDEDQNTGKTDPKEDSSDEGKKDEAKIEDLGVFQTLKVSMVKSGHYETESMSNATMEKDAELLTNKDGENKLVLHYKPAVINGILAYATNLTFKDKYHTEFILRQDNSAICIVDLPKIEKDPTVYEGHIYSSVMDADVAIKLEKIEKASDSKIKYTELKEKAEKLLSQKEYYENSLNELKKLLAKKDIVDYSNEYVELEKAIASLKEKKANPFENGKLFHLEAKDTSVVGKEALYKYARVEINSKGIPEITLKYNAYDNWEGRTYFSNIKVFDEERKEIPSIYKTDKNGNGVLKFEMKYIPAGGIFKTELTEGKNSNKIPSDIKLDYSTIQEGVFRKGLLEAINKCDTYLHDDYSTIGKLEELKDDFTEKSWNNYTKVVEKCREDLKKANLTQDEVDKDIDAVMTARKDLLYKIKAGHGSEANLATDGINNPEVYSKYMDGMNEYPVVVGWAGSKIKFGKDGAVYRVLNNGVVEGEDNSKKNTGKMLLMAESLRVRKPFANKEKEKVEYKDSILRKYLNGEFYDNNFSNLEKKTILESKVNTREATEQGLTIAEFGDNIESNEKIFAPDLSMVRNREFGYASNDSRYTNDSYVLRNMMEDILEYGVKIPISVQAKGRIGREFRINSDKMQTAPCMYIDTNKIMMTLQADKELAKEIKNVEKTENNVWQLVLEDDSSKLNIKDSSVKGRKVTVNYSTENADGRTLVAAVVRDGNINSGKLESIGQVGKLVKNGKIEFEVPKFDKNKDKLYLMAMDLNTEKTIESTPAVEIDMSNISVDKSKLEGLLKKAGALNKSKYTNESVKELNKKVEKARNINNKSKVEQDEVDKAYEELDAAIKDLKLETKNTTISYEAPVKMMNFGNSSKESMANNAIDNTAKIIEKNNKTSITMNFKAIIREFGNAKLEGHLLKIKVSGSEVNVLKKDSEGRPVQVEFKVDGHPQKIEAEVEVDAMNQIAGKSSPQKVNIVIDWNKKENLKTIDDKEVVDGEDGIDIPKSVNSERISGKDRYKTSVEISKKYFKKAGHVVIASGVNYADALVSASYAKYKNAPILLTGKDSVKNEVLNEIDRLGSKNVTIIGGTESLSKVAEKELEEHGLKVKRIAGKDRFETSEKLANILIENGDVKKLALVNGLKSADGLSVSSLATKEGMPVVMINNNKNNKSLKEKISDWEIEEIFAIGGKDSISEDTLKAINVNKTSRIAGKDRYKTSLKIAKKSYKNPKSVFLANGDSMIDALAAGAVTHKEKAPIVLTKKGYMSNKIKNTIKQMKKVIVLGGKDTIKIK